MIRSVELQAEMNVVCLRNSERRLMYLECQVLFRYRNCVRLAAEESPAGTDQRVLLQDGLGRNEAVCEEHVCEQQANGLDSGKGQTRCLVIKLCLVPQRFG